MNRKPRLAAVAGLAFALACAVGALAAPAAPSADKAALLGSWKVVQGTYSDGSLEKELDMSFTFTEATLTNPMDGTSLGYSIDQSAKRISASNGSSSIVIIYRIIDGKTVDFVEMTITSTGKATTIVGKGGMFSSLRLARK